MSRSSSLVASRVGATVRLVTLLAFAVEATSGLGWLTSDLAEAASRGGATFDETVGLAALAGCWLCVGWFGLALLCVVASSVPGVVGRGFASVAERLVPQALRKIVAAGMGLAVATSPAVAAASASTQPLGPSLAVASSVEHRSVAAGSGTGLPPLDRPAEQGYVVTVRRGDCLWSIARHYLGPLATDAEIASAWPRWYAANRAVIGPDPNLIQPGQQLVAPG